MKRLIVTAVLCALFAATMSEAALYKGQREFHKKCKKCHNDGQEIAYTFKRRAWKKLMKNKGEGLAELHLQSPKARKSWKYFKSKKYHKKARHLRDFFLEYAKDSGNVPACN